jgi:hypothetical protein
MNRYPHVDGSRRGLADGDCIHCGASGSLEGEECPVRLRERVNELERSLRALGAYAWTCGQEAPTRDPMLRNLVYNVASDAHRLGLIERGP